MTKPSKASNNINQDPSVEGEMGDEGSLVLYLYIPIVGFPVEYIFKMTLVSRERIDILETSLHEAREEVDVLTGQISNLQAEIEELREEVSNREAKPMITVLRTTQSVGTQGIITWNDTEMNSLSATLDSSNQNLTIPRAGLYQVHLRVTGPDSSGSHQINLQVNEKVVAQSICGFNTNYNASLNLTEFIQLDEDDKLRVYYYANQNMDAQLIYTHFSIYYLGPRCDNDA